MLGKQRLVGVVTTMALCTQVAYLPGSLSVRPFVLLSDTLCLFHDAVATIFLEKMGHATRAFCCPVYEEEATATGRACAVLPAAACAAFSTL